MSKIFKAIHILEDKLKNILSNYEFLKEENEALLQNNTKLHLLLEEKERTYPLSVGNTQEEEGMRRAAKNINGLIAKFEENYAVADKQDVLAMCALQYASKAEISSLKTSEESFKAEEKINALTNLLEKHLK